jgi:hypothetical protein
MTFYNNSVEEIFNSFLTLHLHYATIEQNVTQVLVILHKTVNTYSAMLSIAKYVFHQTVAAADVTLRETLFFKQTII